VKTLGDFFSEQRFPEDQEARILQAVVRRGSLPARAFQTYATATSAYGGFEKHEKIRGARPGTPYYRERALPSLIEYMAGGGKKRPTAWAVYREAVILFMGKELSKLDTLLSEVPTPASDDVAEALRMLCSRAWEYEVSRVDILTFYELWGFERVASLESSIDDWMKPDEQSAQRRQLVVLATAVDDLKRATERMASEIAGLRQQAEAEPRRLQRALDESERKFGKLVSALTDEVRREGERLTAVEEVSGRGVAGSTLRDEVQRLQAASKSEIATASASARSELAEAFNDKLARLRGEVDEEIRRLSSRVSAGAPTADQLRNVAPRSAPFAIQSRSASQTIKDVAALRRSLTAAARARGVEPSLMLQIHAAVVARLTPFTLGPSALAALTAYARGACGDRSLVIHVSPSALDPRDFDDPPGGGLLGAAVAAKDVDGLSLVVLEGANRSPLEASVIPLLQMMDLGLSPLNSSPGLRIAATVVAGVTTVPVSPQLWTHATAIYPAPDTATPVDASTSGTLELSSEWLGPGDTPTELIDALLESWPDCRELRPAMARLGAALARLYEPGRGDRHLTDALLHGLILPHIATSLSADEEAEALRALKDEGECAGALRRLRRRLC
jgi:hypothetical protein